MNGIDPETGGRSNELPSCAGISTAAHYMRMNWAECQPSYKTCNGLNEDYIRKRMGEAGDYYGRFIERMPRAYKGGSYHPKKP